MAVISDIEIRLRADIARLQQDMTRARQSVTSATDAMRKSLFAFAAGFSLVNIAQQVVAAQREFDKLNSSLTTATGSAKSAGEAMKALQDFAARTPFSLQEVTEGFLKLRNLGLNPSERALESYGNTSAAMGKSLNQLVEAVADAATGEFERLKEFGIKAKQQGDAVSLTFQGTTTKIGNNAAEIEEYLTRIGEVNFAGGMARQANTLDGDLSRLGDTWNQTLVAFSQSGFGDVVRSAVGALSDSLQDLGAIFKSVTSEADAEGKKVDELNGVHFLLTTTFETLAVLGLNVAFAFKAVGRNIGAVAAAVANPTQAIEILKQRFSDLGDEWDQVNKDSDRVLKAAGNARAAQAAQDAAQTGDRLAQYRIVSSAAKTASDAEIKAAAKTKDAYDAFIVTLKARVDATAREMEGVAALTEAEKAHVDLTEQIRAGKLKLTKAQEAAARGLIDEAGANDALIRSNKEYSDLQQQLADNAKALAADRQGLIESARQEAERNEELVQTFGMAEAAITRMQAARLLEQEAQRLGRDLTAEEIEDLQRVIELKERSAAAVASRAELEKTKQFWSDIDETARATFTSITDGGKNAFQRLRDTAKNTFFDWLYQQTLKKWIINIQTSTAGANPLEAVFGKNAAIFNNDTLKKIGTTIGGYFAGSALSGAISGDRKVSSGVNVLSSINTALTSYIAGPLGGAVAGVIGGVINRAFGRGPKEYSDNSTLVGNIGAGGFNGTVNTAWTQKGGLFRSSKSGTDKAAVDAMTASGLAAAYDVIKAASTDYAKILGVNADSIANRTQAISIALGKDEAANQKAIADFFGGVADTVAAEILPGIAKFQQEGETAATTLQRVATNFAAVDAILVAMGTNSQTAFRAVGVASIEARERLVALAGGIETLAAQTSFFNENFLTEAERIALIQGPLNQQLAALGLAGTTTTEQFKTAVQTLVQSGALATEEGAKRYAQLLAIAPQFKVVADYLDELGKAAAQTAQEAKDAAQAMLEANETLLRAAVDAAFEGVQRAVEAQRDRVTAAYEKINDAIEARIDRLNDRIGEMRQLSDALKGAIQSINSPEQAIASRMAAQSQITAALAIARASGVLPSADSLKDALAALGQDSSDQFSTFAEYQRDVARTNAELAALGGLTDGQLSVAERQLQSLQEQQVAAKAAYEAEMLRLDGILEWAQAEVDAINGVNRSVLSVVEAIATLKVAGQALQQGAKPSNPGGSALTVDQLYRTVLGREGDAAGLAYWKNILGNGAVDSKGYADFIQGAKGELEMKQPPVVYSAPQSGTMAGSATQQEINARMERQLASIAASTEKFASQFENVSGGGQTLFVENVN